MIGGFYVWPSVYRVGCGESTRVIGKFATYFFFTNWSNKYLES